MTLLISEPDADDKCKLDILETLGYLDDVSAGKLGTPRYAQLLSLLLITFTLLPSDSFLNYSARTRES